MAFILQRFCLSSCEYENKFDDDDDVDGGGGDDICNGCDDDDLDDDNGDIVITILIMVGLPQNDVRMQSFDSECLQFYDTSAIILASVMKYLAKAPLSRARTSPIVDGSSSHNATRSMGD